jgi:hypothetical protein
MQARSPTQPHIVTYGYDALNRLLEEHAQKDGGSYGYTAKYSHDLAGNRLSRCVAVTNSGGTNHITTTYHYNAVNDRLEWEENQVATGQCVWAPNGGEPLYARHEGGDMVYQTADGEQLGRLRAFTMGLPTSWSRGALRVLWAALAAVLLWPIIAQYLPQRRKGTKGQVGWGCAPRGVALALAGHAGWFSALRGSFRGQRPRNLISDSSTPLCFARNDTYPAPLPYRLWTRSIAALLAFVFRGRWAVGGMLGPPGGTGNRPTL